MIEKGSSIEAENREGVIRGKKVVILTPLARKINLNTTGRQGEGKSGGKGRTKSGFQPTHDGHAESLNSGKTEKEKGNAVSTQGDWCKNGRVIGREV